MGESGRRASIEWLLRPRLGLGFALLPSLSLPRRSALPLPAAAAGLPNSGASCRGGEGGELAAEVPGAGAPAPRGAGGGPGLVPDAEPVGLPCHRPGGLRFHVHIKRRPGSWGELAAGGGVGGKGPWRLLTSYSRLHALSTPGACCTPRPPFPSPGLEGEPAPEDIGYWRSEDR